MSNELSIEGLADIVINHIEDSKFQFFNMEDVSKTLKNIVGDRYDGRISVQVKTMLKEHSNIDFFMEDEYIYDNKFYYSVGNWLATKGVYSSPLEAKFRMKWYAWQETEEIDDSHFAD